MGEISNSEILFSVLDNLPKSANFKATIMRKNDNDNEWYMWLSKTNLAVDLGEDININNMELKEILNILADYRIPTEIRYDFFQTAD